MVAAQRVIMFIISIEILLLGLLYKNYIDVKATIIEHLWAYELFFGSQQAICKGSNSLDGGFEK
jgi:hypothetical protein